MKSKMSVVLDFCVDCFTSTINWFRELPLWAKVTVRYLRSGTSCVCVGARNAVRGFRGIVKRFKATFC